MCKIPALLGHRIDRTDNELKFLSSVHVHSSTEGFSRHFRQYRRPLRGSICQLNAGESDARPTTPLETDIRVQQWTLPPPSLFCKCQYIILLVQCSNAALPLSRPGKNISVSTSKAATANDPMHIPARCFAGGKPRPKRGGRELTALK